MIRQSNRILGMNSTTNRNNINNNNNNNSNNNNSPNNMNWEERPTGMNSRKDTSHLLSHGAHQHHAAGNHFIRPQVGVPLNLHDSHGSPDLPLRILVKSDMVGAIIGRSGGTIRQITQQTKARIDVHREDPLIQQDKVITISGSPKSCSDACFKIVEIIQKEHAQATNNNNEFVADNQYDASHNKQFGNYESDSDPEITLKILAHNDLIGRLIGRKGASIKDIMEKTSTTIKISANCLTDATSEHTITVVGRLDQVRQAESSISTKLRAAYVADINSTLQTINKSPYLFNSVPNSYMSGPYSHSSSVLSSLVGASHQASGGSRGSHHHLPHHHPQNPLYPTPGFMPLYPSMPLQAPGLLGYNPMLGGGGEFEKETVNIYIPDSMVGAIIGKSGSAIKEMISTSGASIKVAASAPPTASSQSKQPDDGSVLRSSNSSSKADNNKHHDSKEKDSLVEQRESGKELEQNQLELTANKSVQGTTPNLESNQPTTDASTTTIVTNPQQQYATRQSHPNPRNSSHINNMEMRKVTIVGSPESQCTAQYLIYRKISIESGKSDISLMVEIRVPSQYVGKIIGKGGNTVKQLQAQTRTTIRLPDEKPPQQQQAVSPVENGNSVPPADDTTSSEPASETYVQITGDFQGAQMAQRHIRHMVRESQTSAFRQSKAHQTKSNGGGISKTSGQVDGGSNHHDKSQEITSKSDSNFQSQGDILIDGKSSSLEAVNGAKAQQEELSPSITQRQPQDLAANESLKQQIDCPPSEA